MAARFFNLNASWLELIFCLRIDLSRGRRLGFRGGRSFVLAVLNSFFHRSYLPIEDFILR